MRINFILPFFSVRPIGGLKVAYEYGNELVARGHQVTVIHPRFMRNIEQSKSMVRRLQSAALNTRNRLWPRAGLSWQPLRDEVKLLSVIEPTSPNVPDADIVFATAWQTAEYVLNYPAQKGRKFYLVMDFDPWIAPREVLQKTWNWPLEKIAISDWLGEKVRAAGCSSADVTSIPIGINFERFHLTNQLEDRPKTILMVFSNSESKGSKDGLKALALVRQKHRDVRVTFFGPAYRRRPPGLPDWAEYYGNIPDHELRRLYNQSRIYVCSSLAEGFALPPAEAMACGCAVAATDCGGIREFAIDRDNALLSPAGDPEKLASNILRLLDDDQLRVSLAQRGLESIQQFTWQAAAGKLETVIGAKPLAFAAA